MKIKYLVLALLPLSLMACQTVQNVTDNVISQINTTAAKNLTEYNWTYQGSKASKPLVLSFNADQKLAIQTGCNNQGGTWAVEGNKIVTSPLVSTMMACADDLMKQERLSADIFSEKKVPFEISTVNVQITVWEVCFSVFAAMCLFPSFLTIPKCLYSFLQSEVHVHLKNLPS